MHKSFKKRAFKNLQIIIISILNKLLKINISSEEKDETTFLFVNVPPSLCVVIKTQICE